MSETGIARVLVRRVGVPRRVGFELSSGRLDVAEKVFVRIELEGGVVGFGECSNIGELFSEETQATAYAMIGEKLGPAVVGHDAANVAELHRLMDRACRMNPTAKAAIDMAVYDAFGKVLGVSASTLLGGQLRETIPLAESVGVLTDAEVVESSRKVLADGYSVVKLKGGRDVWTDLRRVELIAPIVREVPGARLRLDANAGYPRADAVRIPLCRADEAGMDELEQPLGRADLRGMREIRSRLGTTLVVADESVWTETDVLRCISESAADIVNIKVQKAGGLFPAMRAAAVADAAGVGVVVGALQETGVGTAASLHLAGCVNMLSTGSDCRTHLALASTMLSNRLRIEEGFAAVPTEPGLGVVIDEDSLSKFAQEDWTPVKGSR